ncbi:hypothetical protein ACJX0J_011088 [Zea mays]
MTYPVCENMYIIQWTWKQSNDAQVHPELNDDFKEVALWTWKIVTFNCTGKNDNGCLQIQRERINFQQGKLQIVVLFDMWKQVKTSELYSLENILIQSTDGVQHIQ